MPAAPTSSTYVIGDVHGCAEQLADLIVQIEPRLGWRDHVVFLGDYLDRGPDTCGVLEQILALRVRHPGAIICLKGNHEAWFLDAWFKPANTAWLVGMQGTTTIRSYSPAAADRIERALAEYGPEFFAQRNSRPLQGVLAAVREAIPQEHVWFLQKQLQLIYRDDHVVCVHAGIDLEAPLEAQTERALLWSRPEPLFSAWPGPRTLAVGHTPTHYLDPASRGLPLRRGHVACLDTGADATGVLTAMRFPDGHVIQSRLHLGLEREPRAEKISQLSDCTPVQLR